VLSLIHAFDAVRWAAINESEKKTGDKTGEMKGTMTGTMKAKTGEKTMITGNITGDMTGEAKGDMTGDMTGKMTVNITEAMTGEMTVEITGKMKGTMEAKVERKATGGIPLLFCLVSVIWHDVVLLWFWATAYRDLPLLGTSNRVWFFVEVDVSGWFRILMLVYSCFNCAVFLLWDVVDYVSIEARRFDAWSKGKPEGDDDDDDDDEDNNSAPVLSTPFRVSKCSSLKQFIKDISADVEKLWSSFLMKLSAGFTMFAHNRFFYGINCLIERLFNLFANIDDQPKELKGAALKKLLTIWRRLWCLWGFSILILTIAGVEKIIQYNGLTPQTDLSSPGQIIPLVLGIIVFIDGASNATVPAPVPVEDSDDNSTDDEDIDVAQEATATSEFRMMSFADAFREIERVRAAHSLESNNKSGE
jgi:hypothetical protein